MLKRIGLFALLVPVLIGVSFGTTASAQEYWHGDRNYYGREYRDGSRWRDYDRDGRGERRWRREHEWREHEWREHEWREHERAERRYYNRYQYSPYTNYYNNYGYYGPY
jgi:hypothetical protein